MLPLYVQQALTGQLTSPLYVQFAPLPPPSYSSITPYTSNTFATPCQWNNANRTALNQCTAGSSGIQILGHYLYGLSASVGGLPLTPTPQVEQDVTMAALTLPLYNFEPGVAYDLVLSAVSGTLTLPGFISFSAGAALVTGTRPSPTWLGVSTACPVTRWSSTGPTCPHPPHPSASPSPPRAAS